MIAAGIWNALPANVADLPTYQDLLLCADDVLLMKAFWVKKKKRRARRMQLMRAIEALRGVLPYRESKYLLLPCEEFRLVRAASAMACHIGLKAVRLPDMQDFSGPSTSFEYEFMDVFALELEDFIFARVWLGALACSYQRYEALIYGLWNYMCAGQKGDSQERSIFSRACTEEFGLGTGDGFKASFRALREQKQCVLNERALQRCGACFEELCSNLLVCNGNKWNSEATEGFETLKQLQ